MLKLEKLSHLVKPRIMALDNREPC